MDALVDGLEHYLASDEVLSELKRKREQQEI
jgi:hypothetical protein